MNDDKKKVQPLIFEFVGKKAESRLSSGSNFIDLTRESDDLIDCVILCPICGVDISCNLPNDRNRHVELCLDRDTNRNTHVESSLDHNMSRNRDLKRNRHINDTNDVKDARVKIGKKPKLLPIEKERLSYINKISCKVADKSKDQIQLNLVAVKHEDSFQLNVAEGLKQGSNVDPSLSLLDDPIKPPTSINSNGFKRKPIPSLKILSFPIDSSTNYELSVDAFNYAPHPTINQYILTHFHGDHYGGISKKWAYERIFGLGDCDYSDSSKYQKIIYCTKITGCLLTLRFKIDSRFIKKLDFDSRYLIKKFNPINLNNDELPDGGYKSDENIPGVYVTPINANHCPGAAIFLFESISLTGYNYYSLHCGDFRVNKDILTHPLLKRFSIEGGDTMLNNVYLDTTYLSPEYTFPKQELVCEAVAQMFDDLIGEENQQNLFSTWFGIVKQSRITDFITNLKAYKKKKKKFLILVGTYLIGKEKLAIAILKKLNCPIYILNIKSRNDKVEIIKNYEDDFLNSAIIHDDIADNIDCSCVIHLVPMNIVGTIKELSNYFNHNRYFESFERCVGLRPTGWSFANRWANYQPDFSNDETSLKDLINILSTCQPYSYSNDILPQSPSFEVASRRKDKQESELYRIYSLPYSEHSSYRELSYFGIFYKIHKIIPTVNFENEESRIKMAAAIRLWELFRKIKLKRQEANSISKDTCNSVMKISLNNF